MEFDELSNRVIGCAIEVHRELGPGLLESAYEECLAHELTYTNFQNQSIPYRSPRPSTLHPIPKRTLEGCRVRVAFRVSTRSRDGPPQPCVIPMTVKLVAGVHTGLLMNFHVPLLKSGIKRFVL